MNFQSRFLLVALLSVVAACIPASPPVKALPVTKSEAAPALSPLPLVTQSGTRLTWYGHATFRVDTPKGKVLWIDPWLMNPKNPSGKEDLAAIDRGDLIFVTHGHFDHVGDAVAIAKKTKAKLVATADLGRSLVRYGGYPKELASYETLGNAGGQITLLDGEVTVMFIPAVHSSAVDIPGTPPDEGNVYQGGNPGGFLISIANGPTIYHTGDTDFFSDMALVSKAHPVTVMLTVIGDHFAMGPARAAEAVNAVQPAIAVPMHYGTFPVLNGTPEAFAREVKARNGRSAVKVLRVKEELRL